MKKDLDLEIGDLVVYPSYGVGEIEKFDKYDIDGLDQDFILINFKQDKMKLRIPREKASSSGLRKLSNKNRLSKALEVLAEKPAMNILVPSGLKVIPDGEFWPLSLFFGTSKSSTNDETPPKALKLVIKKINNKLINFSNFTSYF